MEAIPLELSTLILRASFAAPIALGLFAPNNNVSHATAGTKGDIRGNMVIINYPAFPI